MQLLPIFSVGIGEVQEPLLLQTARQLFKDNQTLLQQTNTGLYTTLQNYNSLQDASILNNQEAVNTLKEVIKKNAIQFYAGLGFDVSRLDFHVVNLWLNEMRSGSAHQLHSHYGFQISGCFYVDVPQKSNLIKFYTPIQKREHTDNPQKIFNEYNAQFIQCELQEGSMYFWESLLQHEVPPLEFEGVRRSIAYDLKISKKTSIEQTEKEHKMNLQDYVAIYNINNPALCKQIIDELEEDKWEKHAYNNPITGVNTSYTDDLDMSYQNAAITNKLQGLFEQCVRDYMRTIPSISFPLQATTYIRFNRYNVGTNMKPHLDHIHTIFDGERKGVPVLSILALLNDDFEGGDFLMFDGKKVKLSVGDIIIFPSNFMYPHAVTTVTKGTRYSCVSWAY
jgi:uncharacterized protein (TIGR02466 family)